MTAPERPDWLPDHVPHSGDWEAFIRTLYAVFESDFKHSAPRFLSLPVWHDRRIEAEDRYRFEEGFWHLVTKDEWVYNRTTRRKEKVRVPEFDRASRLPWAKPVIVNSHEKTVIAWDYEDETSRGRVVRSYLWLKDFDFVVILERQTARERKIYKLITSFHVCYEAKRKDLERRYAQRVQKATPENG